MFVWVVLVAAACGGPAGGIDRDSYESVYTGAQRAVAAGDLEALWRLLSTDGQKNLERVLKEWQAGLRDDVRGRFILERIEKRRGPLDPAELERARYGELADVWHFYLAAEPRGDTPPRREAEVSVDGTTVVIEYEGPRGILREVRLVQTPQGWAIRDFQL